MLHHKEIIPNIRFTKANPKIDFPALRMQVQTEVCLLLVIGEVCRLIRRPSSIAGEHHRGDGCLRWSMGDIDLIVWRRWI